jgi:hypothetical protein
MRLQDWFGRGGARLAACVALCAIGAAAQQKNPWEVSIDANALISSNAYWNWVGSEVSSVTWTAQFGADAHKNLSPIMRWENDIKLSFGETYLQRQNGEGWLAPQKAVDRIDVQSTLKMTLGKLIDPYVSLRAISQFWDRGKADGYDLYINPVELTESFGGATAIVKKERLHWNARLGGAIQQIVDRRLASDSALSATGGLELNTEFSASSKEDRTQFESRLRVYEALVQLDDEQQTSNDWRYPDVNWENTLSVNLMKYLMLSAYVQLLYDREVDDPDTGERAGVRIKNTFSIGLTYSFVSKAAQAATKAGE